VLGRRFLKIMSDENNNDFTVRSFIFPVGELLFAGWPDSIWLQNGASAV
jgi:hypothetical protein